MSDKITDKDRKIGSAILQAFRSRSGIFKDYFSDAANDCELDKEIYPNYVTFVSSIDYQKNIEAIDLWKAAKGWAKSYPWLFKPEELFKRSAKQIVSDFKKHSRA